MTSEQTWRQVIAEAAQTVPRAYVHRQKVLRAAYRAGFSVGAIAEAGAMPRSTAQRILGPGGERGVLLDAPATGVPDLLVCSDCGTALRERTTSGRCGFCNQERESR